MAQIFIIKKSESEGAMRLDAEYYQPKYRIDFGRGSWVTVGDVIQMCQYGISKAMTEEPVGYPIFRMDDIKNAFLADDEVKYIQMADTDLKKYRLELDDILFNRVNSEEFVGRTGIFKLVGDYVFASYLIRIRVKPNSPILADYLNAFLNSSFGIKQIRRLSRRAVNQANVNAEELKSIKIAVLSLQAQEEIKHLCDKSFAEFETSKSLYLQAELLLDELGFKDLDLSHQLYYTVPLKKTEEANRLDAEHFQPKYERLLQHLATRVKVKPLGSFLLGVKKGIEVGGEHYQEKGKLFIRVSNLSVDGFVDRDQKYISEKLYDDLSKDFEPKVRELLLTKDATPGIAYVVKEPIEGIISSGILKLIIDETAIDKEYLALCINSAIGKLQIERDGGGSVITHWKPEQVKRLKIPARTLELKKKLPRLSNNPMKRGRKRGSF